MVATVDRLLFTKQDIEILLDHLPRFGLTTNAALARCYFGSAQPTKKWVTRTREGAMIHTAHLGLRTKYHYLTSEAARLAVRGVASINAAPFES